MHMETNSTNQHHQNRDHNHDHNDSQNHHVIIDAQRLAAIDQKITTQPKLLSKSVGRGTCSIFRVPKSFTDVNGKLYQPQIVSIGPFHHRRPYVQIIEEYKYQYLGQLLARSTNLNLTNLFEAIAPFEERIRECYSEAIDLEAQDLLEMMVVDGCFILELFRKLGCIESDDPIASMPWIFPSLQRDLLRLENQIPYFVLQCLFDLTKLGELDDCDEDGEIKYTLASLCLEFFNYIFQERPLDIIMKHKDIKPKHLLDLFRRSFITQELNPPNQHLMKRGSTRTNVIPSVSKLRQAGIQFRPGKSETFLAVKFKGGIIEMPAVTFDDFMSPVFANCVAYEQCHKRCSSYFTTYAIFVDCLVNTAKDVEYLCDNNVIENCFGSDDEVATFINDIGKEVVCGLDQCYLAQLFDDVHTYYKNNCHVQWASFKYTYFNTPWSFASAVAASVLLIFTVTQTMYTVLPYYRI